VPAGSLHEKASRTGCIEEARFVTPVGQLDVQMQARGDALWHGRGQRGRDRLEHGVASAPINRSHPPQMASKAPCLDKPRERKLFSDCGSHVIEELLMSDAVD
jgi:hypothetical protein